MKLLRLLLVMTLLSGCTGRQLDLDVRWRPLTAIKEGTDNLFAEGMTTTIGQYCYVPDLKQWQIDYPDGSINREAILLHEQVHAKRQLALGLPLWLSFYVSSNQFRWHEEQLGYEAQIRHFYQNGYAISMEAYAESLSADYQSLGGQMVSYQDALAWIQGLITKIGQGQ